MAMARTPARSSMAVVLAVVIIMGTATICTGERRCIDLDLDMALYCIKSLIKDEPKVPPSERCCEAVQAIDIPCMCSFVDKLYEDGTSMEKLVYVMKACNKPLKPGCKCGIYTVPPSSGQQGEDC